MIPSCSNKGHLKASDQVEEASSGGLKSFVFRAKTSARALFVSKQCRTAEKQVLFPEWASYFPFEPFYEQEAAALLLFAGASGVISHVAGSLPSSRASFRVGSLEMSGSRLATKLDESDNSDTRYAEFLTPITRSRARMTAVGKQVQSWLKTIPTLVATLSTDSASAGTLKQVPFLSLLIPFVPESVADALWGLDGASGPPARGHADGSPEGCCFWCSRFRSR